MTRQVFPLLALIIAAGCGTENVIVRDGATPLVLNDGSVLVLPCETWGFSRVGLADTEVAAALDTSLSAKFRKRGLDATGLRGKLRAAKLDGLSRKLGYGAWHVAVYHNSFSLARDACGEAIEEVPRLVEMGARLCAEALGKDKPPRYVFALYVWVFGAGATRGSLKYRVVATVFDRENGLIHSLAHYEGMMIKEAAVAKATVIPGEAFDLLMEKAAALPRSAGDGD